MKVPALLRRSLQPAPRLDLAVVRCLVVAYALWTLGSSAVVAAEQSIHTRSEVPVLWMEPVLALDWITAENFATWRALALGLGVLALVGWWTPITLASFALGNLVMRGWLASVGRYDHIHAVIAIALGVLACTPAGAELSLDARLRRGTWRPSARHSRMVGWPLELIGAVMALAYLSAVASKLVGAGFGWCNGSTLQFYAYFKGIPNGAPLGLWLSQQHALAALASWTTLAFESTFVLCVFWPRLRPYYVAYGCVFHVLADLTFAAPFYSFIVLYSCWIPWTAFATRLSLTRGAHSTPRL